MKNILVIDDDLHIGNVLEETLTNEGYGVIRAYSGTEAVLLLSQVKPDLVLLDLMLPGLSGEEVLPHIKGIPVIIMSAKVDVDNKVALLLGGAVDYMTKPFYTRELLARIAVHLRTFDSFAKSEILTFEEIKLNIDTHIAQIKDVEIKLTRTEYAEMGRPKVYDGENYDTYSPNCFNVLFGSPYDLSTSSTRILGSTTLSSYFPTQVNSSFPVFCIIISPKTSERC